MNPMTLDAEMVVAAYAQWFVVSAICWSIASLAALFFGFGVATTKDADEHAIVFGLVILVMGVIGLCHNLPTAIHPRGYAIHQLITDTHSK